MVGGWNASKPRTSTFKHVLVPPTVEPRLGQFVYIERSKTEKRSRKAHE